MKGHQPDSKPLQWRANDLYPMQRYLRTCFFSYVTLSDCHPKSLHYNNKLRIAMKRQKQLLLLNRRSQGYQTVQYNCADSRLEINRLVIRIKQFSVTVDGLFDTTFAC